MTIIVISSINSDFLAMVSGKSKWVKLWFQFKDQNFDRLCFNIKVMMVFNSNKTRGHVTFSVSSIMLLMKE